MAEEVERCDGVMRVPEETSSRRAPRPLPRALDGAQGSGRAQSTGRSNKTASPVEQTQVLTRIEWHNATERVHHRRARTGARHCAPDRTGSATGEVAIASTEFRLRSKTTSIPPASAPPAPASCSSISRLRRRCRSRAPAETGGRDSAGQAEPPRIRVWPGGSTVTHFGTDAQSLGCGPCHGRLWRLASRGPLLRLAWAPTPPDRSRTPAAHCGIGGVQADLRPRQHPRCDDAVVDARPLWPDVHVEDAALILGFRTRRLRRPDDGRRAGARLPARAQDATRQAEVGVPRTDFTTIASGRPSDGRGARGAPEADGGGGSERRAKSRHSESRDCWTPEAFVYHATCIRGVAREVSAGNTRVGAAGRGGEGRRLCGRAGKWSCSDAFDSPDGASPLGGAP